MRHLRLGPLGQEVSQALLQAGVGHGSPLVLTHVLLPARHDEHLDEALRCLGVAVD